MRAYRLFSGFIALGCAVVSFIVACAAGAIANLGGGEINKVIILAPEVMALAGILSALMCWNKNFIVSICIIIVFVCAGVLELCGIKDFTQAWIFSAIMLLLALGHLILTIKEKRNNNIANSES